MCTELIINFFVVCLDKRSSLHLYLLLLLSASIMSASPRKQNKPRWVNPCDLAGHVFDPSRDMTNAPSISMEELYNNVISRARVCRDHALKAKENFLRETFGDPEFEAGVSDYRQDWLPESPEITDEHFNSMNNETAFQKAYEYLQYFGVGLEQILLDQVLYDGQFATLFREVENHLTQVLCELQLGMYMLKIEPNPDVMRDVMSQNYRDLNEMSNRNLRDFLILRDYIEAANYVTELFMYLKNKNKS